MPVYLDASQFSGRLDHDRVTKIAGHELKKQYATLTLEKVTQLYKDKLFLIVDNFHCIYDNGYRSTEICEILESVFARIVILAAEELVLCESHGANGEFGGFLGYRKFQILDFGQLRMEALAKKWLSLTDSDNVRSQDVAKLTKQMLNVLSADVIPHHPWILIVLFNQSVESESIVVRNGSYGHMYQAIVSAALTRSKMTDLELNGKFTYLAALANFIFKSGSEAISERDARKFHDGHCKLVDVPLDFGAVIADFHGAGVLKVDGNGIRIVSEYAQCFFLAWYLNAHLHKNWAKDDIKSLCKQLYDSVSANTLLFLAHLTTDPFVIKTIRDAAATLFAESPMANLVEDVQRLNGLGGISTAVALPPTAPEQNREQFISEKEGNQSLTVSEAAGDLTMVKIADPDRDCEFVEQMHEIQSAHKMIRILGQVLKNGADSLVSAEKVKIVDEVFRLSRRMLGNGFEELEDVDKWRSVTIDRVRKREVEKIPERKKHYLQSQHTVEDLAIKADQEIVGICWVACFTVVKIVCEATGAKILAGTFEKVVNADNSIPNQLYQLDVLMEHGADFPLKEATRLQQELKGNPFATTLLKSLVAHYFYLYKTKYSDKQRICDRLGIELNKRKKLNSSQKSKGPQRRLPNSDQKRMR